jgi:organic radical activating enzyme
MNARSRHGSPSQKSPLNAGMILAGWGRILAGYKPLLSIEITRECPLSCPGCYAYGDNHLGGGATLRQLSDLRGEDLVNGVLRLVERHRPMQVSFVGGEPLIRHRELSRILPEMSRRGIYSLVVTSAVIPFPRQWNDIPRVRIAVSIDGLQPEHDARRKPATYDRILENIRDRRIDISLVVTKPMTQRRDYLDEYLHFWTSRPEVGRVWLSLYTPQKGEQSVERLTDDARQLLFEELPPLKANYPALILSGSNVEAFAKPPKNPGECTFTRFSAAYSADLRSRIGPCFYGGDPDCSQCGCAVSVALHWLRQQRVPYALGLKAGHIIDASLETSEWIKALRRKTSDEEPAPAANPAESKRRNAERLAG